MSFRMPLVDRETSIFANKLILKLYNPIKEMTVYYQCHLIVTKGNHESIIIHIDFL